MSDPNKHDINDTGLKEGEEVVTGSIMAEMVCPEKSHHDRLFEILQACGSDRDLFAEMFGKEDQETKSLLCDLIYSYMDAISKVVESQLTHLSDRDFVGFVDYVLVQGRDFIQNLLNHPEDLKETRNLDYYNSKRKLRFFRGCWHSSNN